MPNPAKAMAAHFFSTYENALVGIFFAAALPDGARHCP
jgi:hypothetical protein